MTSVEESSLTETVTEQGSRVAQEGKQKLRDQLDQRTTDLGQQTTKLGSALRRSANEIGSGPPNGVDIERIVDVLAERLERAGEYLERKSGDEMLGDAERFVRSRPWLVGAAAAASGFALSRVLKASSEHRHPGASQPRSVAQRPLGNEQARIPARPGTQPDMAYAGSRQT